MKPTIYLIAGCNGPGKTTFAKEFLPHEAKCLRFDNADELARGLSPLDPAAAAMKADRLLLAEIRASIRRKETFALESTLSGKTYVRLLQHAKAAGYRIDLHYLWLPSPAIAIARVRERVKKAATMSRLQTSGVVSSAISSNCLLRTRHWRTTGRCGIARAAHRS